MCEEAVVGRLRVVSDASKREVCVCVCVCAGFGEVVGVSGFVQKNS